MTEVETWQHRQIRSLVTSDLKVAYGARRLEERVPGLLDRAESVLALATGTLAGAWWKELRVRKSGRLIVVTDRRVLLVPLPVITASDPASAAIVDPQPASLPHAETERVEERLGRMESKLDLVTKNGTVRITSMRKQGASSVAEAVRRYL